MDINHATAAELETLPGVGPSIAKEIIAERPFASVNDLERVKGIGEERLKDLKPLVKATPVTKPAAKQTAKAPAPTTTTKPTTRASTKEYDSRDHAATPAKGRVNINTASLEELEALPEIGPVKAQAIIDERPFKSIDEVMRVKGIKEATFEAIKDHITVR